jgi:hypothetical protein
MSARRLKRVRRFIRRVLGIPVLLEEMPDHPAIFDQYRALIATGHRRVEGGWVYEDEFYPDYLTVGGNSVAIRRSALKWCQGCGIDIGAGFWPLPGSTPVDTERGPGLLHPISSIPAGSQDYVFSSHCLEHIENWGGALDEWASKLKAGGVLFLYLPHPSCKLWHRSNPFVADTHKWVPTPDLVEQALIDRGFELVDCDRGPDHFYSFYVCGRKGRRSDNT